MIDEVRLTITKKLCEWIPFESNDIQLNSVLIIHLIYKINGIDNSLTNLPILADQDDRVGVAIDLR